MINKERAIGLLQEIAEREREYVASKDYASNMETFASEGEFHVCYVYDKHNRYSPVRVLICTMMIHIMYIH